MSKHLTIVDYGVSNLSSIQHKLNILGFNVVIENDPKNINKCDCLILPGVGHFTTTMLYLQNSELKSALDELVLIQQIPIFGICLGMQLMMDCSEEGNAQGFGWIKGTVRKFRNDLFNTSVKVPHVGWNNIHKNKDSYILKDIPIQQSFYFTHSYHVVCEDKTDVVAYTDYGYPFTSIVHKDNIFGVQFHPEKSQKEGMNVFKNFINGALD